MLKGTYVGLRAIERSDLPQLLKWRNKPEFRRFFREYRELGMDNQTKWYEQCVLGSFNTRMFSIVDLRNENLIGACGLCHIDWINRNADFSIYIGISDSYIDDIFAPDAALLLIQYGFFELGLHRLWSEIYDFDHWKINLFEKLGFIQEGRHHDTHWTDGAWHDSVYYAKINK